MPELRIILLIAGVLFLAALGGFEWWRARRDRPLAAARDDDAPVPRGSVALPEISVARDQWRWGVTCAGAAGRFVHNTTAIAKKVAAPKIETTTSGSSASSRPSRTATSILIANARTAPHRSGAKRKRVASEPSVYSVLSPASSATSTVP